VKFRADTDLKRILNVMSGLGLNITYKHGSIPATAPNISPAPSLTSLVTPVGGTAHADPLRRPASDMSSSTMRGSSPMKPEVSSSPIKPDFKIPLRPDTAFSDQGQANRVPFSTPHMTTPFSTSLVGSMFVPPSPRARVESFHQFLPQNQSLYVSQMEREVSSHPNAKKNKTKLTRTSLKIGEFPNLFCPCQVQHVQVLEQPLLFMSPKCSRSGMTL